MRKWFKYYLDHSTGGTRYFNIDSEFEQHTKSMGSYVADESYSNKTSFFNQYFFRYHFGRLEFYHDFLIRYLHKNQDILSVGSGRCANELFLMDQGYNIDCSDLEIIDVYAQTKDLFPNLNYFKLNALEGSASRKYDAVISLSLIYLFDNSNLLRFFRNISHNLKTGGHFILDSAGSPDNILSFLINDIYLKYEIVLLRFIKLLTKGELPSFNVKHHGFRRTTNEIIQAAYNCGFELNTQENYDFLSEFRRSVIFYKLVKEGIIKERSAIERFFIFWGQYIPYIRMFDFKKVD